MIVAIIGHYDERLHNSIINIVSNADIHFFDTIKEVNQSECDCIIINNGLNQQQIANLMQERPMVIKNTKIEEFITIKKQHCKKGYKRPYLYHR